MTAGCTDTESDGGDEDSDDDPDTSDDGKSRDGAADTVATSDGIADEITTSESESETDLAARYPNAWAIDEEHEIVVLSADAVVEQYSSTITGEVVNASDEDYEYVQLSFSLLDDADTKIADALANTSGLRAGQRWRYEAVGKSSPDITTFRLTEISVF